jgi:hypothetical protein
MSRVLWPAMGTSYWSRPAVPICRSCSLLAECGGMICLHGQRSGSDQRIGWYGKPPWTIDDLLAPLGTEVHVAHRLLVNLISTARVKTDTRATVHVARLLAANLIPPVWVPPPAVRELRA